MGEELDKLVKLQSRLRNVANGVSEVNRVRAGMCGAVKVGAKLEPSRVFETVAPASARETVKTSDRGKQTKLAPDIEVSVLVLLESSNAPAPKVVQNRLGRIGTAVLPMSQLPSLNYSKDVRSIELADSVSLPTACIEGTPDRAPINPLFDRLNKWDRRERFDPREPNKQLPSAGPIGENVLIGIIDVGGLDFAHQDFIVKGESRVVAIWDQGGDYFDPPPAAPGGPANIGSEITREAIKYALEDHSKLNVTPYDLAPQSQQIVGSHATHVASIAAGNTGICRRAKIAGVMIDLPPEDQDRSKSFYDTGRIVAGISYLFDVAKREDCPVVAINISLGTNGGAHDGSELVSRWIDQALFDAGRVICVAAGNAGQENARFDGDIGHFSGRIHAKGRVPASGLVRDLEWIVVGNGIEDISENELEIWFPPSDELLVQVKPPNGGWIGPVGPRQRIENLMLESGTFVSIYNDLSDPRNGDNRISIYLAPYMKEKLVGITPGLWRVRLTGKVIRNGEFHAWIERDDPGSSGISSRHWRMPSYFGDATFADESTVSSLACGPRIIGVANLDEANEMINVTSSQGPTRDGRSKPDIAAPGTSIVAAKGFDTKEAWIRMSGTSMASPHVCGVSGLMLSLAPHLTAAQVAGIMRRTSRPLPGGGFDWHNASGFGVIDPLEAMFEVLRLLEPVSDITKKPKRRGA